MSMILDRPIETPRLRLTMLSAADCGSPYLDWMNDPRVQRYLESRHVKHDRSGLERFVATCNESNDRLLLGIRPRTDGRHVGNVKLGPIDRPNARASVGIMIGDTSAVGRGYAAEALRVLADHAFATLGLGKLTAGAHAPNVASVRAFERAGFAVEAILPRHAVLDGERVDVVMMGRHAS